MPDNRVEHWKLAELSLDRVDFTLPHPEKSLQKYDNFFIRSKYVNVFRYAKVEDVDEDMLIEEGKLLDETHPKEEKKIAPVEFR